MKNFLPLLLIVITGNSFAQSRLPNDPFLKKTSLFSFHAGITDYKTMLNSDQKAQLGSGSSGGRSLSIGVGWWNSITKRIDFNARYTGTFASFPKNFLKNDSIGTAAFTNEFDGSIVAKIFDEKAPVNPFISAGAGFGFYGSGSGAYAPVGVGVQFHSSSGFYGFVQGQYKLKLAGAPTSSYLHFSIGIAQGISSYKPPKIIIPRYEVPVVLDTDDDGTPDELDLCPDLKGLSSLQGCPDTDLDGIPDKDDKCPDAFGLARYQGCPIPDTDKDDVNDEDDKCPDVPGVARYQGCPVPDSDHDGVNDEEDKCPELAGETTNGGCPLVKEEIQQKVQLAAKLIGFKSSSDELLPEAREALDEVVLIMQKDSKIKLDIEGHTDNTGSNNQQLSDSRATAVKEYLISKNIEIDRLASTGFGDKKPIASNKSVAGREKNRRVELKFRY